MLKKLKLYTFAVNNVFIGLNKMAKEYHEYIHKSDSYHRH